MAGGTVSKLHTVGEDDKKLSWCWQTAQRFRDQSRSPSMVPFDTLAMVSY